MKIKCNPTLRSVPYEKLANVCRQYDSAIGRFYSPDVLSELAYSISPYRFAYNNPIYFNDPTGLFETRKEARAYRREHDITGGISKNNDGSFSINDKENNISYFKPGNGIELSTTGSDGVATSPLVTGKESTKSNVSSDFTIWGTMRDGDTSGRKGTASHSIESSDLVTPGQPFRLNSGTNSVLKFFQWIAGYLGNASTTTQHAIAIEEAVKKTGNISTMETHNIEPVVSASVKVATYNFHLNDSTITETTNTVNFRGNGSDVKRQVDSTKNRNAIRDSDKEAWLRSWNK